MSNAERRCGELWSIAVRLRDEYCQSCGLPGPEAHHIVLKSQANWQIQYDTDYGVGLCAEHHRGAGNAPHVSPKRFGAEVLPRLLNRMEPARAAKIAAYLVSPRSVPTEKPDFKAIRKRLQQEIAGMEEDYCQLEGQPSVGYAPS